MHMYNISESAVHFGSKQNGYGPCSVNIMYKNYAKIIIHDFDIVC